MVGISELKSAFFERARYQALVNQQLVIALKQGPLHSVSEEWQRPWNAEIAPTTENLFLAKPDSLVAVRYR